VFFDDFTALIKLSQSHNGWYTPENVYFSIQSWAEALTEEKLNQWLSSYTIPIQESKSRFNFAGNIPLVVFTISFRF
jgi:transglutaminase-like putative cysteine protease